MPSTIIVEPTGSETHINAELGNAQITLLLRERVDPQTGQEISIAPISTTFTSSAGPAHG